jgi:hypothetical protein
VLSEFLLAAILVVTTLSASTSVLWAEWERARCAYQVFEHTHAARNRTTRFGIGRPRSLSIRRSPDGVEGSGRCGDSVEKVFLPWLEPD